MSVSDFARLIQPGAMAALGGIVFVFIVAWAVLRIPEINDDTKKGIKQVRILLVLLLVVVFLWQVIAAAMVNATPRSTIDRSDVNDQNKKFDQKLKIK